MLMICFSLFSAKSNATKKLKFATAEVTLKMCRLICTFNMVSQGRKQSPPFLFFPSFFLPTHIFLLPFLQSRSRNPTSMMSTCTATEKGKKKRWTGSMLPSLPFLFLSLSLSLSPSPSPVPFPPLSVCLLQPAGAEPQPYQHNAHMALGRNWPEETSNKSTYRRLHCQCIALWPIRSHFLIVRHLTH